MIDATPGNEIPKLMGEGDELFKNQKFIEALTIFEKLAGLDTGKPKIIISLLRCLIQLKRFEEARDIYESFDDSMLENEEILKIKKLIDKSSNTNSNLSHVKLLEEVKMKPDDKDLRFKLAESYLSASENEKGFNELLKIYEQDPNWKDNSAKNKLLEYFDLLGFNDTSVIEARKKLSSIMFK